MQNNSKKYVLRPKNRKHRIFCFSYFGNCITEIILPHVSSIGQMRFSAVLSDDRILEDNDIKHLYTSIGTALTEKYCDNVKIVLNDFECGRRYRFNNNMACEYFRRYCLETSF